MSAQTHNGLDKKWISFGILMLGAGTIYKLGFLKDAFYVPMQEFMGLSHTQIGTAMSIAGLISTFGFLASIYLTDRISKKIMIPLALIGICLCGLWLSTFPSYPIFLLIYCLLAVCADMLYWPTMLKTVRLLGNKEEQGRMFGIMEAGRGLVDTIFRDFLRSGQYGLRPAGSHFILRHRPRRHRHHHVFPAGTGRSTARYQRQRRRTQCQPESLAGCPASR